MKMNSKSVDQHILIVTIAIQGQINPARHLARSLARTTGAHITIAIPVSSHRRLFPEHYTTDHVHAPVVEDAETSGQGLVSYAAYSDGFDSLGFQPDKLDAAHFMSEIKLVGSETLTRLARSLAHPVTCIVYTILSEWAADVARDVLGIPSVLFWTQPAAVFSIYYHYFNGFSELISAHKDDPLFALQLPGLPQLQIKDLPSILTTHSDLYLDAYRDIVLKTLVKEPIQRVLINTFHALEEASIESIKASTNLNLIPIGPIIDHNASAGNVKDLFEQDKSAYLEWLDTKEERSVVYISFGSISKLSREQMKEISIGLKESQRPYLWVVRRDARVDEISELVDSADEDGMIVEWCNQVKVLSHPSVRCFVTHCGWNSTMESILSGVPLVCLPQWIDQDTNAKMVESVWGNGVRVEVNHEERVVEGGELKRCLDVVMGEGDKRGEEIRVRTKMWRDKAREAMKDDGAAVCNLRSFVHEL